MRRENEFGIVPGSDEGLQQNCEPPHPKRSPTKRLRAIEKRSRADRAVICSGMVPSRQCLATSTERNANPSPRSSLFAKLKTFRLADLVISVGIVAATIRLVSDKARAACKKHTCEKIRIQFKMYQIGVPKQGRWVSS